MLNIAVRKKLLPANPCLGVEFPVKVKGLFRPHYMSWSEQQRVEFQAPEYLQNVVRIITETGLRIYKELLPMTKDQVDLDNAVVWIPDSKTPSGIAEVPLTNIAHESFRGQIRISGPGPWLFPSPVKKNAHQKTLKTVWHAVLRRAKIPYFRIYDLRSTYATRLSAGGVADEWVTQLLRQGDAKVFKKYSQMKPQMKREALEKAEPDGKRGQPEFCHGATQLSGFVTVLSRLRGISPVWGMFWSFAKIGSGLESRERFLSGRSAAW
jgi:integrase